MSLQINNKRRIKGGKPKKFSKDEGFSKDKSEEKDFLLKKKKPSEGVSIEAMEENQ